MSGLARLLIERGLRVSGSDVLPSAALDELAALGVRVAVGHAAAHAAGAQVVVVSSAIPRDNPEVDWACANGVPVVKRAAVLGQLSAERQTLAVSGTPGKTTTTAMAAYVLDRAGLAPGFLVGGDVPDLDGSARWGRGRHFVVEADEFDRSFLALRPWCAAVTNVEVDHLDYFGSPEAVCEAFAAFVRLLPADGALVVCADDPGARALAEGHAGQVVRYALSAAADWQAAAVCLEPAGAAFAVHRYGRPAAQVRLRLVGAHNVANALAALALADLCGVPAEAAAAALGEFRGARRRMELRGEAHGVAVYDDYGHHPTEVAATLAAARLRARGRLWCLFQPHTYHRTLTFLAEFADALAAADQTVVVDVYMPPGRERETLGVSSADLVARMPPDRARHVPDLAEAAAYVGRRVEPGDLVLTMGAGSVTKAAGWVLAALAERER
ncbi:MAG: UDP-N-acetylmuramate--L-alanine ligase [Chloroflexi bacterium]|nr:UDP-N-acetylmuramate--L-alanine ligase [Chloroflexota bacterium]